MRESTTAPLKVDALGRQQECGLAWGRNEMNWLAEACLFTGDLIFNSTEDETKSVSLKMGRESDRYVNA